MVRLHTLEEALEIALQLLPDERAKIVHQLLLSLEEDPSAEDQDSIDEAWADEAERRFARIASGEVQPIPWETVRERLAIRRKSS